MSAKVIQQKQIPWNQMHSITRIKIAATTPSSTVVSSPCKRFCCRRPAQGSSRRRRPGWVPHRTHAANLSRSSHFPLLPPHSIATDRRRSSVSLVTAANHRSILSFGEIPSFSSRGLLLRPFLLLTLPLLWAMTLKGRNLLRSGSFRKYLLCFSVAEKAGATAWFFANAGLTLNSGVIRLWFLGLLQDRSFRISSYYRRDFPNRFAFCFLGIGDDL